VGSTSSLKERVYHHRNRLVPGFSKKFNLDRLVYYETCENTIGSRKREVQIKKGSRKAKIVLINKANPS
jgi:putative endonuclease